MKILNYILLLSCALCLCACEDDEVMLASTVSFKEAAVTVSEDTTSVLVPLTLTTALKGAAIVYFEIDAESIVGGRIGNFATYSSYVYLEAGSVRGNAFLNIIDNDYPNTNCSFDLKITKVEGAATAAEMQQTCNITILDDDSKQIVSVGFDTTRMIVNEDAVIFEVPVTVEGLLSDYLTFSVEAIDGSATAGTEGDFTVLTSEVSILEGEKWGVVEIKINDKEAAKEDRSFTLKLTGVDDHVEGDSVLALVRPESAECEVTIKKVVRKAMFADTVVVVSEGIRNTIDFGVKLTAPVKEDVTIVIQSKVGSTAVEHINYEIASKELIIKRGESLATTEISIIPDTLGNVDRYCDFEIVSAIGVSGIAMEVVAESSSRILIENDDSSVGFVNSNEITLRGRILKIPISLAGLKDKKIRMKIEPVLPEGVEAISHFMILGDEIAILEGDSVVNVEVQIMRPDGGFNFGIRIAEINVDGLHNKVYRDGVQEFNIEVLAENYTKLDVPNITTVDSVNAGETSNNAEKVIDTNPASFWHSPWSSGKFDHRENGSDPYVMIFKLDKEYTLGKLEMLDRQNHGESDGAVIETSTDKVTWTKLFEFDSFSGNDSSGEIIASQFIKSRYIRITLKEQGTQCYADLRLWTIE